MMKSNKDCKYVFRLPAILLSLILCTAMLTVIVPGAHAASTEINHFDFTCEIDENGDAVITEVIDINVVNGTEYYQCFNDLGDMQIGNLTVREDGVLFRDVGEWDSNASDKLHKSGIVTKRDGCELCFGFGAKGGHVFEMRYEIKNFVCE